MRREQLPAAVALLLAGAALAAASVPGLLAFSIDEGSLLGVIALLASWALTGLAAGRAVIVASGTLLCGVALGLLLMGIAPGEAVYLIPLAPFGLGLLGGELAARWGELGLLLPLLVAGPLASGLVALLVLRPRALRLGATLLLAPTFAIALICWVRDDAYGLAAAGGTAAAALWALLVGLLAPFTPTASPDEPDAPSVPPTDPLPPIAP